MKDKIYKRAVAFMCVMIVIASVLGGVRSLSVKRKSVEREYYEKSAESASFAVEKIAINAQNLKSVAKRYIENDKAYKELLKSAEDFENADGINGQGESIYDLIDSAKAVYERLGECELTAEDKSYRTELYYNIKSYYSVLAHNEYNESAERFNRIIKTVPASAFAALSGMDELPVFEVEE